MKVITLLFAFIIHTTIAAVATGKGYVTDPRLISQGYACQTSSGILLKDGEINNNYSPDSCAKLECNHGWIVILGVYCFYVICGSVVLFEGTRPKSNRARPYPECCKKF